MPEKPPIGVIGVGWVGLVSAACFAELGHDVWCRDIDAAKIESLRAGRVPIYEPGLEDLVTRNLERLHFELEVGPLMEHARLLFVCVDTPPTYSGDADLSRVEAVIEELPASTGARDRDEEHRAGRHGRERRRAGWASWARASSATPRTPSS